ncbi:hypothetical protein [Luteitalea pratensis]|uniref:hypothetical protein n=1 Tax=Luteitalea pratensis TaxID=1855912 RepID=UPI0012FFA180|nr:hypothetical protein [Luteitalea pratensis]
MPRPQGRVDLKVDAYVTDGVTAGHSGGYTVLSGPRFPVTEFGTPAPGTRYPVPDPVPGTRYPAPGTR